jgi:alpha-glucosidase (family GH31 glycosyl hydrolase)
MMHSDRFHLRIFQLVLVLLLPVQITQGADLGDLNPVEQWEPVASGVWRAELGKMQGEIRYSDLAAAPPRLDALNELPEATFPFAGGSVGYLAENGHQVMVRIPTSPDETLYGFGLQLDGIKHSRKVMTLNVDHWSKGGGRTHAPVPFYISSKGYGVFFNTARFLKIYNQVGNRKDSLNNPSEVDRNPPEDEPQPGPWLAQPPGDSVEAQVNGPGLELLVFSGSTILEVVQRYNLYHGGGTLPPLWGLGFWHRVHAEFNADQVRQELADFEEKNFPVDVIGLEPGWMTKSYPCTFEWQTKRFPDPEGFTRELLNKGIRLNLWENPYISKNSRLYERMFPLSGSHLVWLGIVPDYTIPEARRLLAEQHGEDHIAIGISGYKIDEVDGYDFWLWPDHATFPSGVSGEAMRQSYGLLMQNMLYQDLFKQRNVRTYGLVRAANGGASGYPFVIYSDAYRHKEYLTGMATSSLCGILWTPEARSASNDREWLNRMQTTCFSALAQLNAWSSGKKPWSYDSVTDAVRESIRLRMQLLPYLYTAFSDYYFQGIPPIRAMILEQGFDGTADRIVKGKLDSETNPYAMDQRIEKTDQYMFGPSILVAPFYEDQATQRDVQLPAGNWYDFYSGKLVGNGETISVSASDLRDRIPLFVKDGAIIPMLTQPVDRAKEAVGHPLELRWYGEALGQGHLYEDDTETFDYENGRYRRRIFKMRHGSDNVPSLEIETMGQPDQSLFGEINRFTPMSR